jgi:hypothetical protein
MEQEDSRLATLFQEFQSEFSKTIPEVKSHWGVLFRDWAQQQLAR